MNTRLISVDLAKNVFQVCGLNRAGKLAFNKRVSRKQFASTMAAFPPTRVVMEACYSAHYWGRELQRMGHEVCLVPAQHVTPFVRGNKNDANDALAIAEAAQRPQIRFVPVKSVAQQDIMLLHRLRSRHIRERTALVNQVRGILSEYGVVAPQGRHKLQAALPMLLEDADNGLSPMGRACIQRLSVELTTLNEQVSCDEQQLLEQLAGDEDYQRLLAVPGIGPLCASALIGTITNGHQFRQAREVGAWLGLVPRQIASGNQSHMAGITKRGDRYLRTLLVHGARTVVYLMKDRSSRLLRWVDAVIARRGHHKAVVALAHKLTRIVWAMLSRHETYRST